MKWFKGQRKTVMEICFWCHWREMTHTQFCTHYFKLSNVFFSGNRYYFGSTTRWLVLTCVNFAVSFPERKYWLLGHIYTRGTALSLGLSLVQCLWSCCIMEICVLNSVYILHNLMQVVAVHPGSSPQQTIPCSYESKSNCFQLSVLSSSEAQCWFRRMIIKPILLEIKIIFVLNED